MERFLYRLETSLYGCNLKATAIVALYSSLRRQAVLTGVEKLIFSELECRQHQLRKLLCGCFMAVSIDS